METSITSKTVSQQTISGDPGNIEVANDTSPKLTQSKGQMEIEQTRKTLMNVQEIYFKYLSSQKMAQTKFSVRQRAVTGGKVLVPIQPMSQSTTQPSTQTPLTEKE